MVFLPYIIHINNAIHVGAMDAGYKGPWWPPVHGHKMMTRTIDKLPKGILSISIRSELIQHSPLKYLMGIYMVASYVWFFIYCHGEQVLYPNYVEVFLSLTTKEHKCLGSLKWTTTHVVFLVKCWIHISHVNFDKLVASWNRVLRPTLQGRDLLWFWT